MVTRILSHSLDVYGGLRTLEMPEHSKSTVSPQAIFTTPVPHESQATHLLPLGADKGTKWARFMNLLVCWQFSLPTCLSIICSLLEGPLERHGTKELHPNRMASVVCTSKRILTSSG